jgi:hypothetical protein
VLIVKVPAGRMTTLFAGALAMAVLMFAAVTFDAVLSNVQAEVVQMAQLPEGIPPGTPAELQSIAREGETTPDHA